MQYTTRRIHLKYRSYVLAVLTFVFAFKSTDQAVFGILTQAIKLDLHLTDTQMGFLSGMAFALFYATMGIPIALWADRGNRISITTLTLGLWSILVVACGMATNFWQLLLGRIGVGVGEAGTFPPAQSLIADLYSREERPRAMSIFWLGGPLSVVVGYGLAGWINEWYGWRMVFFVMGVPGILLTLLVHFTLRDPRAAQGTVKISRGAASRGNHLRIFKTLWSQMAYRHLLMGFALVYLFSNGIGMWVPAFLIRTHHISTGELGSWYTLVWGLGGGVGTYLGGYLASRYAADNERLHLRAMAVCLTGFIPLYLGIYLSPNIYLAFALMAVSAVLFTAIFGPLFAMVQGLVAPNMRAISVALMWFFANLIGTGLGPVAVGAMSDLLHPRYPDHSLQIALLMWTPGYLWAAFHLVRAGRYVQQEIAAAARLELSLASSGAR